jgi:hypothetical protein
LPRFECLGVDGLAELRIGRLAGLGAIELDNTAAGAADLDDLVAIGLATAVGRALAALAELRRANACACSRVSSPDFSRS